MINRRNFIRAGALTGIGILTRNAVLAGESVLPGHRVGIIGLDTSHSIAFTKAMNSDSAGDTFGNYRIVAAYPHGSLDIASSADRIPGYTKQMQDMGVEITDSIESLLNRVDVVLLETNDGRRHLEQALPVLRAGKRMFIDKPMAASLADAMSIFRAAEQYGVPVFSSSSLRYIAGLDEVHAGSVGRVTGADTYSPATIEKTHPDLFWYGIHGVETLFAAMGTGCTTVSRVYTPDTDIVTGIWSDNRLGNFRGIRGGRSGYGGTVYGEKAIRALGPYGGYNPLLLEVVRYFRTGALPVQPEETLEILAFMEAADLSRRRGGKPVSVAQVMERARRESQRHKI